MMGNKCLKKKLKHKDVNLNPNSNNVSIYKASDQKDSITEINRSDQYQKYPDVEELCSNYEFLRSKGIMEKNELNLDLHSNYEFLRSRKMMSE